jgi:succinyl-diaminopimelate desuccinylase
MKNELQDILSKLISFYPVTSEQTNVRRLLEFVDSELRQSGLGDSKLLENNGITMLYASSQATKHPKVLLQAHVDVVPATPTMRKAQISGALLKGRGARDMLFATAGYVWLLHNLKKELGNLDLGIMLTGDEEIGGGSTVPRLLNLGYGASVVWLPDAGNNLRELVVNAKGAFNFTLTVHGRPHHGSRPWEGDNAALKLVKLLSELQSAFEHNTPKESTCSITKLEAGDSVNKGPGIARAHLDIRYDNKKSLADIRSLLQVLCDKFSGELSNITHGESYQNDPSSPIIRDYVVTNEAVTGQKVQLISTSGSSDARYFSAKDIPVIMTRPESGGSHSDDEWINLDSLVTYCEVMKEYVLKTAKIK